MEQNTVLIPVATLETLINKIDRLELKISELVNKGKSEYLCIKEVMQVLKCTRNTVNNYVDRGYFSVYQPNGKGSKLMYKRAEIEKFLDGANAQGRR